MLTRIYKENQSLAKEGISPNDLNQLPKTYSEGEFDGKMNITPSAPENWDYWEGYSQGNREYWCKQKGITLAEEF